MMYYYMSFCRVKPLLSANINNLTIVKHESSVVRNNIKSTRFIFANISCFLVNFNILTNNIINYLCTILDQICSFKMNGCLSNYNTYLQSYVRLCYHILPTKYLMMTSLITDTVKP